ncbi:MAG: exodeoxyribonuclease VII small subunit [Ruminococcaceae bacterium]|nr:exodeoxyribonuclease VII small subunit [Oscillospiraceae bacterium]
MKFEEAMARLEAVVEQLEKSNVGLDESLALYEEGMRLIGFCNKKLNDAEQRVEAVRLEKEGFTTEPFGEGTV